MAFTSCKSINEIVKAYKYKLSTTYGTYLRKIETYQQY